MCVLYLLEELKILKFDTEAIAQILLSHKKTLKMKSEAVDRETFNNAI